MNIAINTRFLLPNKMEGFGWYTYEITKRIVENHPEHHFFFFFDRKFDPKFIFSKNVTPVVIFPPARHPVLFYLWFEFGVKRALKKYQIDLFFSPDGYACLSSSVPQIITIHDLNFEHYPQGLPKTASRYLRHFFPKFAQKATKIITVSNYSKKDIVEKYKIHPEKISVVWNGASESFKEINEAEKKETKNSYTSGNDYFLFVGSLHPRKNLKTLLKAFEIYRENKEKSLDLVIVGEELWKNNKSNITIKPELKNAIHFTGHLSLEKLVKITASATCLVYVPYFEGFGIPLVEAMKCGIPIITGNLTSLPEVIGDAGIFVNPFDEKEIALKMEEISNNSKLRENLSLSSIERAKEFSWDKAANLSWSEIEKVLSEI
jgi:glycosyltransferase involved in cell wall biosynthesis